MAYYLTELNSALQLDVDGNIINTNEVNLLNSIGGGEEITSFVTDSGGEETLAHGDGLGIVVNGGSPLNGEYLGSLTLSTASIEIANVLPILPPLATVTVSPIEGELFQADDGTLYMISDNQVDVGRLGLNVKLLGGEVLNVPLSGLENIPLLGSLVTPIQNALDAAVVTLDHEQEGSFMVCFAAGTMIATPTGEVAVEDLSIGDMILTASGKQVPVKWIGRQTVGPLASANNLPVRVRQDALAPNTPNKDLVLTAGHALIIEGLAINAGALVNNSTIDYVPQSELSQGMTYYHIETDNHDVVIANGTEAETYVDYITRQAFDNYDEYVELYGIETRIVEMPQPRISTRRHVPQVVRERLGIEDMTPVSRVA